MSENGIKITVSGPRRSGKSTIVFLLKQLFKSLDIEIIHEIPNGHYHNSENEFDRTTLRYFFDTIDAICTEGRKKILIEEHDMTPREESEFMLKLQEKKMGRSIKLQNPMRKPKINPDLFA